MISEITGIRKEMKNQNQKLRPLLFANIPAAICGKKSIPNNNASIPWSLPYKSNIYRVLVSVINVLHTAFYQIYLLKRNRPHILLHPS